MDAIASSPDVTTSSVHAPALVSLADLEAAARRIARVAVRTPLLQFDAASELVGAEIWVKPEMLQRSGAFKFRGAYNFLAQLTPEERDAATAFLAAPVELPETYLTAMSPESRRGVYRAACRMAVVDHVFSQTEQKLLGRLRDLLANPADIASEIESDVPGLTTAAN